MIPPDPREAPVVRWGDEIFRLLPSRLGHPVTIFEFLDVLAGAIDSVLVPACGYGLSDVVELVLRRVDRVASVLSPVWPAGERPDMDDHATITEAERQAAAGLGTFNDLLDSCSDPARARAALEAHSQVAMQLSFDLSDPVSSFGDVVAVKKGAGAFLPLPVVVLMDALITVAWSLAEQAVHRNAEVSDSWRQQAEEKLWCILAGSGHRLEPLITPTGRRIHVAAYEPKQVLLVDLVATIDSTQLGNALVHSSEALAAAASTFPEDATVGALQVIATPPLGCDIAPPNAVVMWLRDMLRIVHDVASEPADLWCYVVDQQQANIHLLANNELDKWKTWKTYDKSFPSSMVAAAANGRSLDGLLALVEAAAVSPMANHRVPSLALIFDAVLKRVRPGSALVDPAILPVLVDAAHQEQPEISSLENMIPPDPREAPVVRWGDEIFRLLPSTLGHPVTIFEFLDVLAGAIDSVLVPACGYGLSDVVELVLRRVDRVASVLSPVWPAGERPDLADHATITEAELQAAAGLGTFNDLLDSCSDPIRARAALEVHSQVARQLRFGLSGPISFFGPVVAVKKGAGTFLPLPAALLMEALPTMAWFLADQAVYRDAEVGDSWRQQVEKKLWRLLAGSGHRLEPLITPTGRHIHVAEYGPKQVLLIDLVATIDSTQLGDALRHSSKALATTVFTFGFPDARVGLLQVIATPSFGDAIAPSDTIPLQQDVLRIVRVPLQDMLRIVRDVASEPADLWRYVVDLQQGDIRLWASKELDKWTTWKAHGKAFPGGPSITDLVCNMDSPNVEWTAESDRSDLERALLALQLRPTRDWPLVKKISGDEANIVDIASQQQHDIYLWDLRDVPVAVSVQPHGFNRVEDDTIFDWVSGLGFVLQQVREPLQSALLDAGVTALRIEFRAVARPDADPIRAGTFEPPLLVIECGSSLRDELVGKHAAVQSRLGRILGDALVAGPKRSAFLGAWESALPAIRFDAHTIPQTRQVPPPAAAKIEAWNVSKWTKRLQQHLQATHIEPREYAGEMAKHLDFETIHPWLLTRLREEFGRYDRAHLLKFALSQLERLAYERWYTNKQISALKGFPAYSSAKKEQLREQKQNLFELNIVVSFVVEELLAYPSSGQDQIDKSGWVHLISLAELLVMSGLRSEAADKELQSYKITITDTYGLQYEVQDEVLFDLQAFWAARTAAFEPPPLPMSEPSEGESGTAQPGPASSEGILGRWPALRPVDDKFREEHGFGLDTIVDLLAVAYCRQLPESCEYTTATVAQVAQDATEAVKHLVSAAEYEAAIEWLALDADPGLAGDADAGPVRHWELESRAERIVVRPFVRWGDEVFILPWAAEAGLRILLSSYLPDMRLPWPASMAGPETTKVLGESRQARNVQLERRCKDALTQPHVRVKGNIKQNKARKSVGIDHLSGEIDVLAVDERSDRIWVVEVKDPYFPYSLRLMNRQVQDFHKEGGYVDKLRLKVEEVARCGSTIAAKLGVETADREWQTRGVIVTRRITPAAFTDCKDVLFRTIEDVGDIVNGDNASRLCLS